MTHRQLLPPQLRNRECILYFASKDKFRMQKKFRVKLPQENYSANSYFQESYNQAQELPATAE